MYFIFCEGIHLANLQSKFQMKITDRDKVRRFQVSTSNSKISKKKLSGPVVAVMLLKEKKSVQTVSTVTVHYIHLYISYMYVQTFFMRNLSRI
jgi:hypothetical protein